MTIKKINSVMCILLLFLLCGCEKKIQSIYISPESIEIEIDQEHALHKTALPENATEQIVWKSLDESIVVVDENGMIKGVTAGTAQVVVSGAKSGISAKCDVVVNAPSAIKQLNEDEKLFFDVLIEKVLPSFYNAPAARVKQIGSTLGKEDTSNDTLLLDVRLQGTNKMGGTLFKDYLMICNRDVDKSTYCPCFTNDGLFQSPHEWYESTKVDIAKINLALEEYWENSGMKQ